jgi:hypothetical protein
VCVLFLFVVQANPTHKKNRGFPNRINYSNSNKSSIKLLLLRLAYFFFCRSNYSHFALLIYLSRYCGKNHRRYVTFILCFLLLALINCGFFFSLSNLIILLFSLPFKISYMHNRCYITYSDGGGGGGGADNPARIFEFSLSPSYAFR